MILLKKYDKTNLKKKKKLFTKFRNQNNILLKKLSRATRGSATSQNNNMYTQLHSNSHIVFLHQKEVVYNTPKRNVSHK